MAEASAPPATPDFDALYRADPDPWQVGTSWYERRKLAVTLAALPRPRYATAWEPGCGPGFVSRALAERTGHLLGSDGSPVAVAEARERCADLTHVEFVVSRLPDAPSSEPVELVLAAEFLYYLPDLAAGLDTLVAALAPQGHLAVVHWAHDPHDGQLSGASLHARLAEEADARGLTRLVAHRDVDFVLDVYERR